MKEYSGLKSLRSGSGSGVYCPKCNNYLEVVGNGWFHGDLFFCPKENLVFAVTLVTKKVSPGYLKQCQDDIELKELRYMINRDTFKKAKELLANLK